MPIRRLVGWVVLATVLLGLGAALFGFWHAGYRAYVVHTGSMSPTLVPGDVIIDRPASSGYQPGDVITFRHSAGPDLVTHRITDITASAVHTRGDANESADVWNLPPDFVRGVVEYRLPGFGYAVVFLRQPTGFASVACSLVALIFLWRLFFPPSTTFGTASSRGRHRRPSASSAAGGDPDPGPDEPIDRSVETTIPDDLLDLVTAGSSEPD